MAGVPEGCASIQRDLSGQQEWDKRNPTEFSNEKCQILHLVRKKCKHQDLLETPQWESSLMEKDLWVLLNTKLGMSWQHTLVVRGSGILGCIKQSNASRSRGVTPLIQCWQGKIWSSVSHPQCSQSEPLYHMGCCLAMCSSSLTAPHQHNFMHFVPSSLEDTFQPKPFKDFVC